jgi:hypothetical protein
MSGMWCSRPCRRIDQMGKARSLRRAKETREAEGGSPGARSSRIAVLVDDNQKLCDTMSRGDFRISYFALAKRYHPDRNPGAAELMANINAARTAILNSYRKLAS